SRICEKEKMNNGKGEKSGTSKTPSSPALEPNSTNEQLPIL
ncbi:hypothetical protein NPIL_692911, partial [Nephila pilipes]